VKSKLAAQVASVQTLVRRQDQYVEPALVIIDEAHRAMASTYLQILEKWPNARVIGLTATPERTDGKGLDSIFETIVLGPQIRTLIDDGYLCDYELMAPPSTVNLDGVHSRGGDFDAEETEAIVDRPAITGDAVQHYLKHAAGKRCVVMAITIKHGQHVVDEYRLAGVTAELICGDTPDRDAMLKRFAAGHTHVLVNVQLMIEGVDIPAIEVIQWLRPTKSLIVWMQGNGRGLRPALGKDFLLILDHVGNWNRPGFGMPDTPRVWTLKGRKERAKREPVEAFDVRQCPACYNVYRATLTQCPRCNTEGKKTPREIEVIAGELQRVVATERKREVGRAHTLDELIQVGMRRGMKSPAEWAAHKLAGRQGRQHPTTLEFMAARKAHAALLLGNRGYIWEDAIKSTEETI
jgi:superfamily II DNA or RNA helicase